MTKNTQLLEDFTAYCKQNPELRFWQALRNWSGYAFVCVSNDIDFDTGEIQNVKDTYYWEGKNG